MREPKPQPQRLAPELGLRLLTGNLDTVGQMSCNPAIGGVAKGQIVREIDALGGLMGQAIDATGIQFRMLNRRKGPAMHSPRAQADKRGYQMFIKQAIEHYPGISLVQELVEDLIVEEVAGDSSRYAASKFAEARRISRTQWCSQPALSCKRSCTPAKPKTPGGRAGEGTSAGISGSLTRLGFQLDRFKTGTPPRLNAKTIDFAATELQPGDEDPVPFSYLTESLPDPQVPCLHHLHE